VIYSWRTGIRKRKIVAVRKNVSVGSRPPFRLKLTNDRFRLSNVLLLIQRTDAAEVSPPGECLLPGARLQLEPLHGRKAAPGHIPSSLNRMRNRRFGCGAYSSVVVMAFQRIAPSMAPTNGATQNIQSCASAGASAKRATPVERAGFTEVFVTGIEMR